MHTDELRIKLCLEILLQFTHKEEKELYVKQNNIKQFFLKSFIQFHILHNLSSIRVFFFLLLDEMEKGFMCSRKESHAWKIEHLV